jgi:diguanylate cyclase (GGDEF)-like protein/PAS domain S-box-containing protein
MTGAALAGLIYSVVAAVSTATGHGVFAQPDMHVTLVLLWSYMATTVLTGLLITALQAERLRAESTLRESELQLRTIIDSEPKCVKTTAADGTLLQMNRAGLDMIEADSADQVIGHKMSELIAEPYREQFRALTRRVFEGESGNIEFRVRGLKGSDRWLDSHTVPMRDARGVIVSALSVTRDITERKYAEEQLRIAACAFESQESMIITDANNVILRVNRAFTEITGYTAEEVTGKTPRLFMSDRHGKEFYRSMWKTIHQTGGWQGEVWDRRKNGEVSPKWLTVSAVKNDEGTVTHYIGTHFDITERKKAEEKIRELAFFDQLTGLPNRTLLQDRLRQTVAASSRDDSYGALLFIDLDHFKKLNDTLGHDVGDLLLKQVAQRVTSCIREGDTAARIGGDEFVVMLTSLGPNDGDAAASTEVIAEKILAVLNQLYQLGDVAYHSTSSIGVTLFKGSRVSVEELMRQADLAMYRSKAAGRNAVRFFDPAMELAVMERAAMEDDLRRAIEANRFLLHYQAQVTGDGRVTGAEVLVRWQHPQQGLVPPDKFIPLAEETGLILPLGHWVLQTACAQLAVWAGQPEMAQLTVAVNVSAHQFRQASFVDQVFAILQSTGANPQRLKLELTESMLVSNVEDLVEKMHALKAKGIGFSLDDFGTGYSSLSYLKRLPLDQLKIDRSFVHDVLIDSNDAAIAKTIIALAQSLGLGVIAEGVETSQERNFLANAGCHAYQGYFFTRPLPLEGFEAFVRKI